jgi:hypothetical protein
MALLLVADFFAYEAMKESDRFEVEPLRPSRLGLVEFFVLHSIKGRGCRMTKSAIVEMKRAWNMNLGSNNRRRFLAKPGRAPA